MISVQTSISGIRGSLATRRGTTIGFVPTMGALHRGHAHLIEMAAGQAETIVVSIFVNPLQFDQPEDYARYQRSLEADTELAERSGAHVIFAPTIGEMYPPGAGSFVEVPGVTEHFCGASRHGHFRGVTTVVAKLLHIVQPDLALFGEKDAQQLAAIRAMVRDLNFPVTICPVATIREPDGLALSSRNARLTGEERQTSACLYKGLTRARLLIEGGERDAGKILQEAGALLQKPGVRIEYFDVADPDTMQPVRAAVPPVRVMGAIWIGSTRLIDNVLAL
jgi:pantoate--beta-alanine ligase